MAGNANSNTRRGALLALGEEIHTPKTADLVARRLRRLIIRGELKEGETLAPESELLEEFHVSRPTMREAIRVLEAEGLIVVRRGARGGAMIQLPKEDVAARYAGLVLQHRGTTLQDVYEARAILEAPAAGLAAKRRKKEDLAKLRSVVKEAEQAADTSLVLGCHHEFHALVVKTAGSETLSVLSAMLSGILSEANLSFVERPQARARQTILNRTQRTHERLVELIADRDASAAEELWRRHLVEAGHEVLRGLPETSVLELLA